MDAKSGGSQHLRNLVTKIIGDFATKVEAEKDVSNVLLKGHLLIENVLEELLTALDVLPPQGMDRASFHDKVKALGGASSKDPEINGHIKKVTSPLYALNRLRNDLAHDLHFSVSESGINKVGLTLGSKFIVQKYTTGHKEERQNLLFCLDRIVNDLGFLIYVQIDQLNSQTVLPLKEIPKVKGTAQPAAETSNSNEKDVTQ